MIFTGSIITFAEGKKETALEMLKAFPQVEIHSFSEDGLNAVVSIESTDSKELENLTETLKKDSTIKDIAHHYMYFGEETEKLLAEGNENPDLGQFFKSARNKNGKAV